MPVQSTVRRDQASGFVGDIVISGPMRGMPAILNSTSAANNVVGRGFFHVAGNDLEVTADTVGAVAGILFNRNVYALQGTPSGTLEPSIALPNNAEVSLVTMTSGILVTLSTAANIGDNVFIADATGILAASPNPTLAGHTIIPNAQIVRQNTPAAGRAIVELT